MWNNNAIMDWSKARLIASINQRQQDEAGWYGMLKAYYLNNGLYDQLQRWALDNQVWSPAMKGLRNPAHRVIDFYAAKLWPEPLTVQSENPAIIPLIDQVWRWSNWGDVKRRAARWFALYGDVFIKVATKGQPVERVYLQVIAPEYVTDFDEDERGHLTYIKIKTPITRREADGKLHNLIHVEEWSKETGLYRTWESVGSNDAGRPLEERSFSDFGIDFIPFVRAKFADTGEKRSPGAFVHALDKIDEANRMATRLHQVMFRYNKPTIAIFANDKDSLGRPLPAPRIGDGATADEADEEVKYFPGHSSMQHLVANLNYDAMLRVVQDQLAELERDLPELGYYRLREMGRDLSGRAVKLLMSDASDRLLEARGNILAVLAQADAMALTIGTAAGLWEAGSYDAGNFAHTFAAVDPFGVDALEAAQTIQAETAAGIPLATSLRRAGWSEAQIDQMLDDQATEQMAGASLGAAYLDAARRKFDQGQSGA